MISILHDVVVDGRQYPLILPYLNVRGLRLQYIHTFSLFLSIFLLPRWRNSGYEIYLRYSRLQSYEEFDFSETEKVRIPEGPVLEWRWVMVLRNI